MCMTLLVYRCFIKTGEGYKGYNYFPNGNHRCEKNVLIVRQKDNESLNWMKIRRFPELMNNSFSDFKVRYTWRYFCLSLYALLLYQQKHLNMIFHVLGA